MTDRATQRLVILGTATALTSAQRDNTALYFEGPRGGLLIDCPGNVFGKILRAAGDPLRLRAIILTHAHPDHIYGLPSLLHELWLAGRTAPIDIYAHGHALGVAGELIRLFELDDKPLPINLNPIHDGERVRIIDSDDFVIETSPVQHLIPVVAVRITLRRGSGVVAYSSDTGPCPALVNLAREADLLLQECALQKGSRDPRTATHCAPEDAGEIAAQAEVKEMLLVHYPDSLARDPEATLARVRKYFAGQARFARDGEVIAL